LVQFPCRYGETERAWSFPEPQGASRAGTGSKSKTEAAAGTACEESFLKHAARGESLDRNGYA
jgi:hypothetical protein